MSLKVKLYNLFMRIAHKFAEPECCGLLRNSDGHLVKYDEWEGYQSCYFPGCGHYQSEHGDGTPSKVLYSKDHPELVGTEVSHAKGCWNAGCEDCPDSGLRKTCTILCVKCRVHATTQTMRWLKWGKRGTPMSSKSKRRWTLSFVWSRLWVRGTVRHAKLSLSVKSGSGAGSPTCPSISTSSGSPTKLKTRMTTDVSIRWYEQ